MPWKLNELNSAEPNALEAILAPYFASNDFDSLRSFGLSQRTIDDIQNFRPSNQYLGQFVGYCVEKYLNPVNELTIPGDALKFVFTRDEAGQIYDGKSPIIVGSDLITGVTGSTVNDNAPPFSSNSSRFNAPQTRIRTTTPGLVRWNPVFGDAKTAPSLNRYLSMINSYGGVTSQIINHLHGGTSSGRDPISSYKADIEQSFPGLIEEKLIKAGSTRYTGGTLPNLYSCLPFGRATGSGNNWWMRTRLDLLLGIWWGFPWSRYLDYERSGGPMYPEDANGVPTSNVPVFGLSQYNTSNATVPSVFRNATLDARKYAHWWFVDRYGNWFGDQYFVFGSRDLSYDTAEAGLYPGSVPCVEFPDTLRGDKLLPLRHPFGIYDETGDPEPAADYIVEVHLHFEAIAEWIEAGCPCDWPEWGGYVDPTTQSLQQQQEADVIKAANQYVPTTTTSLTPPLNPKVGDLWRDAATGKTKAFVLIDQVNGTWVDT